MTENQEFIPGMYIGDRGVDFKSMLIKLLKSCEINEKYIKILTSEKCLEVIGMAFTSEMTDELSNYQFFEQLGDVTCNKFIVTYIYNRFPQLQCTEGVKVAARVKINYGSKQCFSTIADKLGFWGFISAPNELRHRRKKPLLEDVFEAFIGVIEYILDCEISPCVGYACAYKILQNIFDKINISLKYEDLYDAKTRLKELFDYKMDSLGPLEYYEEKNGLLTTSTVSYLKDIRYGTTIEGKVDTKRVVYPGKKIKIGEGCAALKSDARQVASKNALENLAKKGISKQPPEIYTKFSSGNTKSITEEKDILNICGGKEKINELINIKNKSKFQYKYTCTVLSLKCKERDYSGIKHCIKLGSDPNIKDTHGMTCMDNLLIGRYRPKLIDKVVSKFFERGIDMIIDSKVYEVYGNNYDLAKYMIRINII
jgi:dsRNA-specific ribonuclease